MTSAIAGHARLGRLFACAGVTTPAVRAAAFHLLKAKGPGGQVTYKDIEALGYSRRTAFTVARRLCGLKFLKKSTGGKGGRGKKTIFEITWGIPKATPSQMADSKSEINCEVTKDLKDKEYKQSKDAARVGGDISLRANGGGSNGSKRRSVSDYTSEDAERVVLLMGARFYCKTMMRTRLELESWGLPEDVCDAIEGLIGRKIDGMVLNEARRLVNAVIALRSDICKLAAEGASAHKVCSFICGQLTRWWRKRRSRSKRELLRRANELGDRLGTTSGGWSCRRCQKMPVEREGLCVYCFNEKRWGEYLRAQPRHPERFLRHNEGSSAQSEQGYGLLHLEESDVGRYYVTSGVKVPDESCRRCRKEGKLSYGLCDDCRREMVHGA